MGLRALCLVVLVALLPTVIFAQKGKNATENTAPKADVIIHTSYGDIGVMLYEDTPLHRENFLKLAHAHFFDSTTFHRVIQNFMIQGGDPNSKSAATMNMAGQGGPGYTIPAEILPNHFHKKGVLAAARLDERVNPSRASNGSQFYIVQGSVMTPAQVDRAERQMQTVLGDDFKFSEEARNAYTTIGGYPFLDMQYTAFGEVVFGLEVVDKIAAVEKLPGDRPKVDVKMAVEAKTKLPKKKKAKKEKKAKK